MKDSKLTCPKCEQGLTKELPGDICPKCGIALKLIKRRRGTRLVEVYIVDLEFAGTEAVEPEPIEELVEPEDISPKPEPAAPAWQKDMAPMGTILPSSIASSGRGHSTVKFKPGIMVTGWVYCPECGHRLFQNRMLNGSLSVKCSKCHQVILFVFQQFPIKDTTINR